MLSSPTMTLKITKVQTYSMIYSMIFKRHDNKEAEDSYLGKKILPYNNVLNESKPQKRF